MRRQDFFAAAVVVVVVDVLAVAVVVVVAIVMAHEACARTIKTFFGFDDDALRVSTSWTNVGDDKDDAGKTFSIETL